MRSFSVKANTLTKHNPRTMGRWKKQKKNREQEKTEEETQEDNC